MPRKRHKPEEIVTKLRQVDVLVSQGQGCRQGRNRSPQIGADIQRHLLLARCPQIFRAYSLPIRSRILISPGGSQSTGNLCHFWLVAPICGRVVVNAVPAFVWECLLICINASSDLGDLIYANGKRLTCYEE
jgi:hypothetical protein